MIISVLDHNVELVYVDDKVWTGDNVGDFQADKMLIRIWGGMPADVFVTTLYHELSHVKVYLMGKTVFEEEQECNHDALFWYSLVKNNPKLFSKDIPKSMGYTVREFE